MKVRSSVRMWRELTWRTVEVEPESIISLWLILLYLRVNTAKLRASLTAALDQRDVNIPPLDGAVLHGTRMSAYVDPDNVTNMIVTFEGGEQLLLEIVRLTLVEGMTVVPGRRVARTNHERLVLEYNCLTGECSQLPANHPTP